MKDFRMAEIPVLPRIALPVAPKPAEAVVPAVVFGSQQVKPLPLVQFGGDITIAGSQDVAIDVAQAMGNRCNGFLMIGIVGLVQVSINGSGLRTVTNDLNINDSYIYTLRIVTGPAASCIVQLHGV